MAAILNFEQEPVKCHCISHDFRNQHTYLPTFRFKKLVGLTWPAVSRARRGGARAAKGLGGGFYVLIIAGVDLQVFLLL